MNAVVARRVKVLGFMVEAETVENQTQKTFEDAGDEENGPDHGWENCGHGGKLVGFLSLWMGMIVMWECDLVI